MQNDAIYHIGCDFVDMSPLHKLQCRSNASKILYNTLHFSTIILKRPSYLNNTYGLCCFVVIDHIKRRHMLYNFECNFFMFVTSLWHISHVPFEIYVQSTIFTRLYMTIEVWSPDLLGVGSSISKQDNDLMQRRSLSPLS